MSINYSAIAKQAASAIQSAGQALEFTRETKGLSDPATGTRAESTYQNFSANGVVLEYSAKDSGLSHIEGTVIRKDDKKILLEANGYIPDIDDEVNIKGVSFTVVGVKPLSPAGVDVIDTVQVRR